MEEDIKTSFDIEVKLVAGSGGVFNVSLDNQEIFSKKQQGRFPEPEEILSKLK